MTDEVDLLSEYMQRDFQRQNAAIDQALERAGAPPGLHRLVNLDDLEFNDKGEVANADALAQVARDQYPELFGADSLQGDMNERIRAALGRPSAGQRNAQPRNADGTFTGSGSADAGVRPEPPKTASDFINQAIRRAAGR